MFGIAVPLGVALACSACSRPAAPDEVAVAVVDQRDRAVRSAELDLGATGLFTTDERGVALVPLSDGPVSGVIRAERFLAEPVVFGLEDAGSEVRVPLYTADVHWSLHATGDVMVGRRYLAPSDGDPLVDPRDPGPDARDLVADIAGPFGAASLGVVNLETVVGNLPLEEAYPAKKYLLQTPPEALSALEELGVDVVDLANNHVYDWEQPGVDVTLESLEAAGLPWFGAGGDAASAEAPLIVETEQGVRVALVGLTTVDGDGVNRRLARDGDPMPDDLPPERLWEFESRTWGFDDGFLQIPVASRRAGTVWELYEPLEEDLPPDTIAAAFQSMREVYPEIQDITARRGHGGAAALDFDRTFATIRAAEREADVVVVQLHAGVEYSTVRSDLVRRVTELAVDGGADLVIAHHPHVYQGAAFQDDALILYSLGNFMFDQDFYVSKSSIYLRAVFAEDTLVEARLVPIEIVDYQPHPIADAPARRTLRQVWERSQPGVRSILVDEHFRLVEEDPVVAVPALPRFERHTAVLEPDPGGGAAELDVRVSGGDVEELPDDVLVDPRLGLEPGESPEVLVGRDLFGWGRVEDRLADGRTERGTHWTIEGASESVRETPDGPVLQLERDGFDEQAVSVRTASRIPLMAHRLYDEDTLEPLDPEARYAVRLHARASGVGQPQVRFVFYREGVDDPLGEHIVEVDIGRRWVERLVWVEPEWLNGSDGEPVNQVLPYLQLLPPRAGQSTLQVRDMQLLELREAGRMPAGLGSWDVVLHDGGSRQRLTVPVSRPSEP